MKDFYVRSETFQRIVEPGNGSRYWVIVGWNNTDRVPFVALPDYGKAATMAWYGHTTVEYVIEKLRISIPDAEAVAKILNEWVVNPAHQLATQGEAR